MSIIERLTTLFAPDDCLGCGREGLLLCDMCLDALPMPRGYCFGCHVAISSGVCCPDCLASSGCSAIAAACDYSGTAKLLVACLKFRGNQAAAKLMARRLAAVCAPFPPGALLTNAPATTGHIRQRGFDQASLVARELSRLTGLPWASLLRRSGQKHQLGADRQTRLRQLSDSVAVTNGRLVRGAHIILVDDVLTTGSSLQVSARTLLASGACRVDGVVFAQAIESREGL